LKGAPVPVTIVSTVPSLAPYERPLFVAETVCSLFFLLEHLARLFSRKDRLGYAFSIWRRQPVLLGHTKRVSGAHAVEVSKIRERPRGTSTANRLRPEEGVFGVMESLFRDRGAPALPVLLGQLPGLVEEASVGNGSGQE
jgi:hypothetical protein